MLLKNKIVVLFRKQLNEKVIKITDCSNGIEQTVKIVNTDKNKYIVKSPHKGKEIMIYRENFVCTHLNNKFLPKIIFKNKQLIIESFIEGENLNKLQLNQKETKKIYSELGKNIRKIHKIKMSGLGELQKNAKGRYATASGHINYLFKEYAPSFLKIKTFDKKLLEHIKKFIYKNIKLVDTNRSVLLHFDLHNDNFLAKNNKLSGIIDFGDISCGPAEYDLAKLYIETPSKIFSYIMKGYNKKDVDLKKIKYFAILHLLYMTPYFYKKNKKRYEYSLELLKNLSNY